MGGHANAKLGPAGRLALVRLIGEGASLRAAGSESLWGVGRDCASVVASLRFGLL